MTWISIIALVLFCIVKVLMTCLPTGAVEWLLGKYKLHLKLSEVNTEIVYNGIKIEGAEKADILKLFNEATVREKYSLYPGSEEGYLHPENADYSLTIHTKNGNKELKLLLSSYKDRVDVVKQYKNKIVVYSTYPFDIDINKMIQA